ncbi:MAG: hypothetical protein ACKO96_17840 [Flammeovirgaceae bacterium]
MSFVTTILLVFPGLENEMERINEVNSFTYRNLPLDIRSVDWPNKEPYTAWYGGTKFVNGCLYLGSYNHFKIDDFLRHLSSSVNWEYPEYVQLFVRNENEWNYNIYSNAGKDLVYRAIEQ